MKRSDNPPKANLLLRIVLLTALLLSLLFILVLRLRDGGEAALPPAELPSAPAAADTENTVLVLPPVETPEPAPEPTPEPERVYELPRLELNGVGPIKMDEYSRSGSLVLYDVYGNVEYEDDAFSWRTHGNSTARFGKLPVKLKLSRKADLLGMGKADKYILLANAYDKTLIRKALAFDLGAELGLDYTSQYRYVDLYISGQYRGNYMLIEAVDIGADRVNIHPAANEFLLEVFMGSYTPEGPSVTTGELGIRLEVFGDELDDTQRLWLESFLTEAEKALLSGERSAV
ncbi:MAG: CotH kinase family protein, partial [Clostridiales bacterium]|nr:CotH kinase family protein [Candidatus Apopatocola equi]